MDSHHFKPSKTFLKNIDSDIDTIKSSYHSYISLDKIRKISRKGSMKIIYEVIRDLMVETFPLIETYVGIESYGNNWSSYDRDQLESFIFGEAIFNSYIHSPSFTPLDIKAYYGREGFGFGMHDGGNFFEQPRVKESIEHTSPIRTGNFDSPKNLPGSGQNLGFKNIYTHSDFLEVDSSRAIFYIGMKKERLMKPKNVPLVSSW